MPIGERIREIRERLGLSQTEFADKINVSKQTLYKYENNIITNIPSDKIEAAARIANISPSYLMGWDDDSSEEHYYLNDDARELAEFLFQNPDYKVLFDASRSVKKEDIEFVKKMIDKVSGRFDD